MAKAKPLNDSDKYYIENNRELPIEDIMSATGKSKSAVTAFVETLTKSTTETPERTESRIESLMAKNDKGATIMTEGASSMSDEARKSKPKIATRHTGAIHRIKD